MFLLLLGGSGSLGGQSRTGQTHHSYGPSWLAGGRRGVSQSQGRHDVAALSSTHTTCIITAAAAAASKLFLLSFYSFLNFSAAKRERRILLHIRFVAAAVVRDELMSIWTYNVVSCRAWMLLLLLLFSSRDSCWNLSLSFVQFSFPEWEEGEMRGGDKLRLLSSLFARKKKIQSSSSSSFPSFSFLEEEKFFFREEILRAAAAARLVAADLDLALFLVLGFLYTFPRVVRPKRKKVENRKKRIWTSSNFVPIPTLFLSFSAHIAFRQTGLCTKIIRKIFPSVSFYFSYL